MIANGAFTAYQGNEDETIFATEIMILTLALVALAFVITVFVVSGHASM